MSALSAKSAASDERKDVTDIAQLSIRARTRGVEAQMSATEVSADVSVSSTCFVGSPGKLTVDRFPCCQPDD